MVKTETKIPSNKTSSISSKKRYKGVRMRSWGSWVSEIRAPNQKTRIWLGSYSTPEAAARAYDAALLCLKGSSANLNFPENIQHHPNYHDQNTVMSPKSIQRVAAAAAAANPAAAFPKAENSNNKLLFNVPQSPFSTSSGYNYNISSSNSSPSLSSSSPNSIEDDHISLAPDYSQQFEEPSLSSMASWYNFDSPKYNDMINGAFFDPMMMVEDMYEDSDIRLWSFC